MSSAICYNFDQSKILSSGIGLTGIVLLQNIDPIHCKLLLSTQSFIILEFLTHGPTAQQSKNSEPYCDGYGTACHPPLKSILSILGSRRTHSLEASFLWKTELSSIRFVSFSYIIVLHDCQISFS